MCFPNISNGKTLYFSQGFSYRKTLEKHYVYLWVFPVEIHYVYFRVFLLETHNVYLREKPIRNTLSFSTRKTLSEKHFVFPPEKPKEKLFEVLSELWARIAGGLGYLNQIALCVTGCIGLATLSNPPILILILALIFVFPLAHALALVSIAIAIALLVLVGVKPMATLALAVFATLLS